MKKTLKKKSPHSFLAKRIILGCVDGAKSNIPKKEGERTRDKRRKEQRKRQKKDATRNG
ncbi:hypothetical protein J0818_30475 [Bacillus cereus]|uniref:hypothetical protein n=1 Tax=Bacillus cereus TaxID=1396 RepID=UPI002FDBE38C